MFAQKNFTFRGIMMFAGGHLVWISAWTILVIVLFETSNSKWLSIPSIDVKTLNR